MQEPEPITDFERVFHGLVKLDRQFYPSGMYDLALVLAAQPEFATAPAPLRTIVHLELASGQEHIGLEDRGVAAAQRALDQISRATPEEGCPADLRERLQGMANPRFASCTKALDTNGMGKVEEVVDEVRWRCTLIVFPSLCRGILAESVPNNPHRNEP